MIDNLIESIYKEPIYKENVLQAMARVVDAGALPQHSPKPLSGSELMAGIEAVTTKFGAKVTRLVSFPMSIPTCTPFPFVTIGTDISY